MTLPAACPAPAKISAPVPHFHVCDHDAGCLPEGDTSLTTDTREALDDLAHRMETWADSESAGACDDGGTDEEVGFAYGLAEAFCTCRDHSADIDAKAQLADGQTISYRLGDWRVFEITPCTDPACVQRCPNPWCGTVLPADLTDDGASRCPDCGTATVH